MEQIVTKVQAILDFDVNEEIKTNLSRKRKISTESTNKDREFGIMIEERHLLDKALQNKKMSFKDLIHFLNKK